MSDETPSRDTSINEFQDPMEKIYDPPTYEDPLEEALAEEPVAAIQAEPFATVSPDTPVHVAVERLADLHHACLLVEDEGKLVGVFSHRDMLNKVALEYHEVKDSPVRSVMTPDPIFVYDTDSSAAALCVMAVSGYRHVPVVDVDQKIVGIVGPHRVLDFLQSHFSDSNEGDS